MYRTRRIVAAILAVLTAVLLFVSALGWWGDRYLLDSRRFTSSASDVLAEEDVQAALTVAITEQISKAAGTDLRIVQPFISSIVTGVVRSDQFQSVFDAAVRRTHRAVVGGGAREAVLNLSEVVDRVRNAIEPIAPEIADKIPSGKKVRLVLLDETQLNTIYDTVNLFENLVAVLTVLTVLCFAAAIAVSPRRWRTLALTGWVTIGLFAVGLIALRVGRSIVGGLPDVREYSDAARSAYQVIVRGLVVQSVVILVLALLVALFAGWTDRNGGWAGVEAAFRRGTAWAKAQLPQRAPEPALATAAAGAVPAPTSTEAGGEGAVEAGVAATTRAVVEGALAPRLPEPRRAARATHWWRAAGLLVLGMFAVLSPGSLTTIVVVLLGVVALYLALTEALAAWGSPKPTAAPAAATPPAESPSPDA